MVLKFPANTAPRKTRTASTAAPSFGPSTNTVNTVTILASPSFTPGMGTGEGIWASSMKMVRAMAASSARSVSFFVFNLAPPFHVSLYPIQPFPVFHGGGADFLHGNPPDLCQTLRHAVQLSGVVAFSPEGFRGHVGTVGF